MAVSDARCPRCGEALRRTALALLKRAKVYDWNVRKGEVADGYQLFASGKLTSYQPGPAKRLVLDEEANRQLARDFSRILNF